MYKCQFIFKGDDKKGHNTSINGLGPKTGVQMMKISRDYFRSEQYIYIYMYIFMDTSLFPRECVRPLKLKFEFVPRGNTIIFGKRES